MFVSFRSQKQKRQFRLGMEEKKATTENKIKEKQLNQRKRCGDDDGNPNNSIHLKCLSVYVNICEYTYVICVHHV